MQQAITIESLKSDLGSLALRIAAFESQQKKFTVSTLLGEIELQEGEVYVGLIADGSKAHHIILLPGEFNGNWKDAMDWAESIGGELPDRVEGALLFATMKDDFEPEWYWTREQHVSDSACAWVQFFSYGYQGDNDTDNQNRARAVRRLPI